MPEFERGARQTAGLVALASTLAVAVDLSRRRRSKLRGFDPSTIEPRDVVILMLTEASQEVFSRFLDLAPVPGSITEEGEPLETLKAILALKHISSSISTIHQRLLSLYPDVEPELVERARELQSDLSRIVSGDEWLDEGTLAELAFRGIGFAVDVEDAARECRA